ncbi:hypothetical protein Ddc_19716 [Ditylenchus destructor]|nr:hypothetical protein Ddc_19716 [Ditylenchus destructor]
MSAGNLRVVADVGTHHEVLGDGHAGEGAAAFRHHHQALLGQVPRALALDRAAHELDVAHASGGSPVTALSVVVLPAPLAPIRQTSSPWRTSKSTPLTAWMPPYATLSPSTWRRMLSAIVLLSLCRSGSGVGLVGRMRAQIRFNDLGVALHVRGRALGDLLAVIEHRHPVAQAHYQRHVVLDQQDGPAVVADAVDQLAQHDLLGRVHAGGRLVQRQQLGVGGQGAGDFQAALVAVGQRARGPAARGRAPRSRPPRA